MVEEDAERVHVRRRRGEGAAEPLGGVVGVGCEAGDPRADLVNTEVGDVGVALVVEQHVLGSDPTVDDPVAVRRGDA